jgi:hypothetical protein
LSLLPARRGESMSILPTDLPDLDGKEHEVVTDFGRLVH